MVLNGMTPKNNIATADQVFEIIRNKIVSWEYVPGYKMSEQKVSDELGVSRTPVREAFIRLIAADLLEAKPYRGTFVTRIDLAQVAEARFIRQSLETAVVMAACRLNMSNYLHYAYDNIEKQRVALQEKDYQYFLKLDDSMHEELFVSCNKRLSWKVIMDVNSQYQRLRAMFLDKPSLPDEHKAIVDAIKNKDETAAVQAAEKHLSNIKYELVGIQREHPEYFLNLL